MSWNQTYRLRYSVRSSLWIIPIIAIPLAIDRDTGRPLAGPALAVDIFGFRSEGR